MTMDVIIEFYIIYLIKPRPNTKLEFYKTYQWECYYAHDYYTCTKLTRWQVSSWKQIRR